MSALEARLKKYESAKDVVDLDVVLTDFSKRITNGYRAGCIAGVNFFRR